MSYLPNDVPAAQPRSNTTRNIIIGVVVALVLCCCCSAVAIGLYACGDLLTGVATQCSF